MTSTGPTMHQTTHRALRGQLRTGVLDALTNGPGAPGGLGLAGCRAAAALYALLLEHPVDARGHCRSCRRPGAVTGRRRRRCGVYRAANYWLTQPTAVLLCSALARELGLPLPPRPLRVRAEPDWPSRLIITGRADPPGTGVGSRDAAGPNGSGTAPGHAPAVSSPPVPGGVPGASRSDPDHGGAGEDFECPRPRRGPPDTGHQIPDSGASALCGGGALCRR